MLPVLLKLMSEVMVIIKKILNTYYCDNTRCSWFPLTKLIIFKVITFLRWPQWCARSQSDHGLRSRKPPKPKTNFPFSSSSSLWPFSTLSTTTRQAWRPSWPTSSSSPAPSARWTSCTPLWRWPPHATDSSPRFQVSQLSSHYYQVLKRRSLPNVKSSPNSIFTLGLPAPVWCKQHLDFVC